MYPLICVPRIRQNIRDGHTKYPVTGDFWPAFLYPHAKGDPTDVAEGFLRSAILVKVSIHCHPKR